MIDDAMRNRLEDLVATHAELELDMANPEVLADQERYTATAKRHAELAEVVVAFDEYSTLLENAAAAEELAEMAGPDDEAMFRDEAREGREKAERMEDRLQVLLLPKDPLDDKNVILEIRAGAGGDEAGLFAAELERMYVRYAEGRRWSVNRLSVSDTGIGGIKEVTFEVNGSGAYSVLKHESGVHRVQRIPATESGGRIHTSTASVAVMPEAEDVDVQVDPNDLKIDVYRSSGPGGQSVNTTDSAVRITHAPTGLVVSMQDEKSQLQNKEKALRVLKSRLLQAERDRVAAERADARASQIGTGDRSEKIRTYNFPQSRVTDHRINFTTHDLDGVMGGDLSELLEALIGQEQRQKLQALTQD
ncbi:peptide chain release factor 1 [Euzebya tangerina]|uniref:peptide chain release factor 1 n=1 Tax=Euzebya tangerina TaxID=591198 RepID=UPI001F0BE8BA|nr:peptide chain release factor 1 [Euzebya tangerina]